MLAVNHDQTVGDVGSRREATLAHLGHMPLDDRHRPVANVCVDRGQGRPLSAN